MLKTTVRLCKNADAIFYLKYYDTKDSLTGFSITITEIKSHLKNEYEIMLE